MEMLSRLRAPGEAWPAPLLLAPVIVAGALLPMPSLGVQLLVLVPLVVCFGLPHGATDWNLAKQVLAPRLGRAWVAWFCAFYAAGMACVAAAVVWAPAVALAGFLAIAVWHFGAEDGTALRLRRGGWEILACGVPAPLGPALFWPGDYAAVVARLGVAISPAELRWIGAAAIAAWAVALCMAAWRNRRRAPALVAESAALVALAAAAPPIAAFAAYWCLLHAPRHMRALPDGVRGWQTGAVTVAAIVICGGAAGWAAWRLQADADWLAINAVFWGLAALTVPHVIAWSVAERLAPAPRGLPHIATKT